MYVYVHMYIKRERERGILFSLKKEWNSDISLAWIDLEDVMLSKINQTQKGKYHMIPLIQVPRVAKFMETQYNGACQGPGRGGKWEWDAFV